MIATFNSIAQSENILAATMILSDETTNSYESTLAGLATLIHWGNFKVDKTN